MPRWLRNRPFYMLKVGDMPSSVSVVIASYNSASFIGEALESVFEQTVLPLEIIVVDDASTDATVEIISSYKAKSPVPLRLIENKTNSGGPSYPMNRGIEHARGKYIAQLDHDDKMANTKIALVAEALEKHPQAGLAFGQSREVQDGQIQPMNIKLFSLLPIFGNTLLTPALAFQAFMKHGYFFGGAGGMAFPKRVWEKREGLQYGL